MQRHAPQGKKPGNQQCGTSQVRVPQLPEQGLNRAVHRQISGSPIIGRAKGGEEFRHDRAPIGFPFGGDRPGEQSFAHIGGGKARDFLIPRNRVVLEQPVMARPGDEAEEDDQRYDHPRAGLGQAEPHPLGKKRRQRQQ